MIDEKLCGEIEIAAKKNYGEMEYISDFLFKNPELGTEEYVSSAFLMELAKKKGFTVTSGYCDLDTSFLAEFKNGEGPVIGFIAEYDALPGLGPGGFPAHACGHNWISAVSMGTAMILLELKEQFQGTIRVIGTPAMENVGCKAEMIKAHAFDDVDVVIQSHLEKYTSVESKFLAMDAIEFSFKGRSSHASAYPEEGINALDAVQFTFMGINALRQYLRSDVKLHGIVSEGGDAPSVIPGTAACRYYIRAKDRTYLESIKPKIIRCAEGAALMAGAEMTMSYFENSYDNMINNPVLTGLALEYMGEEGIEPSPEYMQEGEFTSSDIGNVSHICPTLYMEFDIEADGEFRVHDERALQYVNSKFSTRKLHQISKIMAKIAMELFLDKKLLLEVEKAQGKVVGESIK